MSTQKKSSGREIAEELFTPGYFDRARQRATRRKSRWNLLLLPAVMLGIGSAVFFIVRLADLYLGYRGCPPLFSPDTPEWKRIVVVCGALFCIHSSRNGSRKCAGLAHSPSTAGFECGSKRPFGNGLSDFTTPFDSHFQEDGKTIQKALGTTLEPNKSLQAFERVGKPRKVCQENIFISNPFFVAASALKVQTASLSPRKSEFVSEPTPAWNAIGD